MSSLKIKEDTIDIDLTDKTTSLQELIDNPSVLKDVVEQYLQFNIGGSFISTCFDTKRVSLREVFSTYDSIFNKVFPAMVKNSSKIQNYRVIDSYLLSMLTRFICYGFNRNVTLVLENIEEYVRSVERACYLYYDAILNESTFTEYSSSNKFVVGYEFFLIATYVAALYSKCIYDRLNATIKMRNTKDLRKMTLLKPLVRVSCEEIDMEKVDGIMKYKDSFELESDAYKSYSGVSSRGGKRKMNKTRKSRINKRKNKRSKTRKHKTMRNMKSKRGNKTRKNKVAK